MNIYRPYKPSLNQFGKVVVSTKKPEEYNYLVGMNINEILLFEDGTDQLLEEGRTILPRHYFIFVGTKDGEYQFKPYELNEHRIVVSTYKDIIVSIDSIG